MLVKSPRNLFVSRIEPQGEVRGQHRWRMSLRRIVRIGHRALARAILRCPLMRARRTLRQFPFIAEQVGKEVVVPLRRRRGPNHFQSAADRVCTMTFAQFILPSEALILNVGAFWFVAHILSRNAGPMRLAEGVTAGNQCYGLFIVHRHAGEGLADIPSRGNWIGLPIRPFRVHIDQTHLHRTQMTLKLTIAAVTLVGKPRTLRTPVHLFRFPNVLAAAAKTKSLESHRLQRYVSSENDEVSPGNFPSILLFDRPQQPPCLIEVHVVRPAIERSEALLPRSSSAAPITDAVRARAVPRHANEKRPIVA